MNPKSLKRETIPPLHSNPRPRLCLQPAAYVHLYRASRSMSSNSCQYDLDQWSRILLGCRPFPSNRPTMAGLPFHAATLRGVTLHGMHRLSTPSSPQCGPKDLLLPN